MLKEEGFVLWPRRQPALQMRVHGVEVALNGTFLKRALQDFPVVTVGVGVFEHQAIREQAVEQRVPGEAAGELPLAVFQHDFIGFGAEQHQVVLEQGIAARDQPEAAVALLHQTAIIPQKVEGLAEQRQTAVAGDMGQIFVRASWVVAVVDAWAAHASPAVGRR